MEPEVRAGAGSHDASLSEILGRGNSVLHMVLQTHDHRNGFDLHMDQGDFRPGLIQKSAGRSSF